MSEVIDWAAYMLLSGYLENINCISAYFNPGPKARRLNSRSQAIYAPISSSFQPFHSNPGVFSLILALTSTIDVTFLITDSTLYNLTIPTSELSVGPFAEDPSICQTLVNAVEGTYVLGGCLLKRFNSVWCRGNERIGFASLDV